MKITSSVSPASRSAISQSVYFMLQHDRNSLLDYEEVVWGWADYFFDNATEAEKDVFKEVFLEEAEEGPYTFDSLKETLKRLFEEDEPVYQWILSFMDSVRKEEK